MTPASRANALAGAIRSAERSYAAGTDAATVLEQLLWTARDIERKRLTEAVTANAESITEARARSDRAPRPETAADAIAIRQAENARRRAAVDDGRLNGP